MRVTKEFCKEIIVDFADNEKAMSFFVDKNKGLCIYLFASLEHVAEFLAQEFITDDRDQYSTARGVFFRFVEGVGEFGSTRIGEYFHYSNKNDAESMRLCGEIVVRVPAEFDIY